MSRQFRKLIKDDLKINFQEVYSTISVGSLINTYSIIYFSQFKLLFNNYPQIFNAIQKVFGKKIFHYLVGQSFGKQFLSGKNLDESRDVARQLGIKGFDLMAFYMAEYLGEKPDQKFYQDNLDGFLEAIDLAHDNYCSNYFVAIKFTGLVDYDILKKANLFIFKCQDFVHEKFQNTHPEYGRWIDKEQFFKEFPKYFNVNFSFEEMNELWSLLKIGKEQDRLYQLEWRLNFSFYNLYNENFQKSSLYRKLRILEDTELLELKIGINRVIQILEKAKNVKNLFMITDAEQSYLQQAIFNVSEQLAMIYNYDKNSFFINTFQCYLSNSIEDIELERNKVNFFDGKYPCSIKLVRGAYMTEEAEVEKLSGRKLLFSTKKQTDENYDNISVKVSKFLNSKGKLIIASHNNDSVYNVMEYIEYHSSEEQKQFLKERIYFATLFGLNDYLSYQCLFSNYNTIKSLSYGESDITIPFLIRRGVESKEIMERSSLELDILGDEILRRFKLKK